MDKLFNNYIDLDIEIGLSLLSYIILEMVEII